jgi:hypothetical protein
MSNLAHPYSLLPKSIFPLDWYLLSYTYPFIFAWTGNQFVGDTAADLVVDSRLLFVLNVPILHLHYLPVCYIV